MTQADAGETSRMQPWQIAALSPVDTSRRGRERITGKEVGSNSIILSPDSMTESSARTNEPEFYGSWFEQGSSRCCFLLRASLLLRGKGFGVCLTYVP